MAFISSSLTTLVLSPIAYTEYLFKSPVSAFKKSNQNNKLEGSENTNLFQYCTSLNSSSD